MQQQIKRVEIIIDDSKLPKLVALLEKVQVSGYTIIEEVCGKGHRGIQDGHGITDVFKNKYVLIACSAEQAEEIAQAMKPMLRKVGGVCLISDATWVQH